jgi:hypothetical protein
VDGGLPLGKEKSTDNLNIFYTPPSFTARRPRIRLPASPDLDYGTARFVVQYD